MKTNKIAKISAHYPSARDIIRRSGLPWGGAIEMVEALGEGVIVEGLLRRVEQAAHAEEMLARAEDVVRRAQAAVEAEEARWDQPLRAAMTAAAGLDLRVREAGAARSADLVAERDAASAEVRRVSAAMGAALRGLRATRASAWEAREEARGEAEGGAVRLANLRRELVAARHSARRCKDDLEQWARDCARCWHSGGALPAICDGGSSVDPRGAVELVQGDRVEILARFG